MSDTYYVPQTQKRMPDADERRHIGYYQWTPLILMGQALLFYLPVMLWRGSSSQAGVEITNVVQASRDLQHGRFTMQRPLLLKIVTLHLDRYLTLVKEPKQNRLSRVKKYLASKCFLFCGRTYGNSISAMYLTFKLWNVANVLLQFVILNAFLGDGFHMYGIEVVKRLAYEHDWVTSPRFPLVTMCDFDLRKPNDNIVRHTVQCVLQINLFNEKIFLFVWFWLVFVLLVTVINFVVWLYRSAYHKEKIRYVMHHLKSIVKDIRPGDRFHIQQFVYNYLKLDGVLVLRIVGANGNDLVVAEILRDLWQLYKGRHGLLPALDPSAPRPSVQANDQNALHVV